MKKNLTFKETIFVASMLFGMFFGAGNLIFPVSMGQMAVSYTHLDVYKRQLETSISLLGFAAPEKM